MFNWPFEGNDTQRRDRPRSQGPDADRTVGDASACNLKIKTYNQDEIVITQQWQFHHTLLLRRGASLAFSVWTGRIDGGSTIPIAAIEIRQTVALRSAVQDIPNRVRLLFPRIFCINSTG